MSHCSPKFATRGSVLSRSRSADREVDIVNLGNLGWLGSLGGNSPGHRRRRLLGALFHDWRLGLRLGRFIDLEPVDFGQNVNWCGLLAWPRPRRCAFGFWQRRVKAGGECVPGLGTCNLRRAPVSRRDEKLLALTIFNNEDVRVRLYKGVNSRSRIFLALRV